MPTEIHPSEGETNVAGATNPERLTLKWNTELKLCVAMGFGSGLIGAIVGVVAMMVLAPPAKVNPQTTAEAAVSVPAAQADAAAPPKFTCKTRPRTSGEGVVLQIYNASGRTLNDVVVSCVDPRTSQKTQAKIDVWDSNTAVEIGEKDWLVAPGQTFYVQVPGMAQPFVLNYNP